MPNYDYHCHECKSEWEDFNTLEERHHSECRKCGIMGTLKVTLTRKPVMFNAQYFEHIAPDPVYAGNKQTLKDHLKRNDCYMPYAFD